jgi:hypothetical protein
MFTGLRNPLSCSFGVSSAFRADLLREERGILGPLWGGAAPLATEWVPFVLGNEFFMDGDGPRAGESENR